MNSPRKGGSMRKKFAALLAVMAFSGAIAMTVAHAGTAPRASSGSSYEPVLDPAHFVSIVDNPYYPLPVGRVIVYKGRRDGQTQTDTVTVTNKTKLVDEGITAVVVRDVATHQGALLEKTFDYYAQDDQGNVWYVGEDTKAYEPNGTIDTSGSWEAGVNDGEPGLIMEAHPQIPDAYRQEYLQGEAEDTAWIVKKGGAMTLPYGRLSNLLFSLESTRIEPGGYDQKVYAPGIGIVFELSLTGDEIAKLVSVTG
jgi:hypothetical protein